MALRGNLSEISLPDIFQLVTFSRKSGVLHIARHDGARGSIWFREGEVYFAQSNWRSDPLGERLVRAQRITPKALDRALTLRATEPEGGRRLGEILVAEGYIAPQVIEQFVQEQMQDTIFDLMRWDEGEFEFEPLAGSPEEDIGLAVSLEDVIMEGSRRLDEWNRIKRKIPSGEVVFKMATAPGEGSFEISLKPVEWNLLLLVDGTRSVTDLARATGRTDFEVSRVLYGLFSAGLLEFAEDEQAVRLRQERIERERRIAAIQAQRQAEEEAALAREADAERARVAQAAVAPRVSAAPEPEAAAPEAAPEAEAAPEVTPPVLSADLAPALGPQRRVDVPEFLGEGRVAPSPEDTAVLSEMMGAVLSEPAPTPEATAPTSDVGVPRAPAEEPAFIAASRAHEPDGTLVPVPSVEDLLADLPELRPESPSVQAAAEAAARAATDSLGATPTAEPVELPAPVEEIFPGRTGNFAQDLMALGLGELPATLGEQPAEEALPAVSTPPVAEGEPVFEPIVEPMGVREQSPAPAVKPSETPAQLTQPEPQLAQEKPESAPPEVDFSALRESLDVGADDSQLPGSEPPAVISTDEYAFDDDLAYGGDLTDELSALTGADRPVRPTTSINRLPEKGSEGMLRRDVRVNRETVLKIIDGIQNL